MNCTPEQVTQKLHNLIYMPNQKLQGQPVMGYDFNKGVNYPQLFKSYSSIGFQATNLGHAIRIVNRMIDWRLSHQQISKQDDQQTKDPSYRQATRTTIFLGYTSNMVSCGMRQIIRYLVQHKMVDCIVTSGGGIEQDFMKCMNDFRIAEYHMDDKQNRLNGHCRIGNILVTNETYIKLQEFLMPLLAKLYKQQKQKGQILTPSKLIWRMGQKINHESSIYYWAWKNKIPVFCPGISDGAIGDILFTNTYKNDLVIDLAQDIKLINKIAMSAKKSAAIILGGGVPKHHILNANIWRNGLDFAVFINTGLFQDGSDSGAKIQQAFTWGKLKLTGDFTKIYCQASLIFPILVAQTFAKRQKEASKL